MRTLSALVVGCAAFLVFSSPGRAAEPEPSTGASPLRRGTLPNGLRYIVVPHGSSKGEIALRLVVHAGSLDERDDERGYAHFIEHMAFNGTEHFRSGAVVSFFTNLGLQFGADLNASTTYTHTTYMIDLPKGRADQLENALLLLRDYAAGVLFEPEEVKKEIGVVVSELIARDNNSSRTSRQILEAIYAGTRLPEREPIGIRAQLESVTPEKLRALYRRTYHPARLTVIVAGAIDAEVTIKRISEQFGSIVADEPATKPAEPIRPPKGEGVIPEVVQIPTAKGSQVILTAIRPRPADTPEGTRAELLARTAMAILDQRMAARREREDVTRFGLPGARYESLPIGPVVHFSVALSTTADGWSDAVAFCENEVRRASTLGFTAAEVNEETTNRLNSLRNRTRDFASMTATRIASGLTSAEVNQDTWRTPEEELAEVQRALDGVTAADVTAALRDAFSAGALHLTLLTPTDNSVKPAKLLASYTASANRTVKDRPAATETLRFAYEDFGTAGQISKRERVDDLDLTLATFANDVRVNVKPSDFEPGRFRIRAVFPANYSDIPIDRGGIADFAGQLVLNCNLKKQKLPDLVRLMKAHSISPGFSVVDGTPVFTVNGPANELRFALSFLTALLSDLDIDDDHYRASISAYAGRQKAFRLNAVPFAQNEALYAFLGKDSRVTMTAPELLARFPESETEGWLRDHILRGPLEIGIIGDVTVDDAINTAAASIGTLKRRQPAPKPGAQLKMPSKAIRLAGEADLPASAASSSVLWPVFAPDDPRRNAALMLATDVFREQLLASLRETLGASYSPTARVHRDLIQRDFAYVSMISTFDPQNAERFTEGSIRLAAQLAQRGVTSDAFARAREPARTKFAEDMRNNNWWLNNVVSIAQSRPEALAEARRHGDILDHVSLDDVNEAARVFAPGLVTAVILKPKPPKPQKP